MDWLTSFRLGKMPLADALFFYLTETGAHPGLLGAYAKALSDYEDGKISDLAEGFGIAMTQRQKSKIKESIEHAAIKELVEELSQGERVGRVVGSVDGKRRMIIEEYTKAPLKKTLEGKMSVYKEVGKRLSPIKGADGVRDICRGKKKCDGGK